MKQRREIKQIDKLLNYLIANPKLKFNEFILLSKTNFSYKAILKGLSELENLNIISKLNNSLYILNVKNG